MAKGGKKSFMMGDAPKDITYKAEPTPRLFHSSSAFVRGMMGCYGCVSGDTEYLTPDGWRRIDEYQPTSFIGVYDPKNGAVTFDFPEAYIDKPCETMYHFRTKYGIDQMVSAEHRIPFVTQKGVHRTETAEEIAWKHLNTKGGFVSRFLTTFTMCQSGPSQWNPPVAVLRLMVAVIADGHFPKEDNNRCRINVKKERKKVRLRKLLTWAKVPWTEKDGSKSAEGYTYFFFDAPRHEKEFGREYWWMDHRRLEIVVDEVRYWDGHVEPKNNHVRFTSTIKASADFVQYAFSATGHRASLRAYDRTKDKGFIEYTVIEADNPLTGFGSQPQRLRADAIKKVPAPNGRKYCFTTSTGYFVARRNGCVFITGNSGKSSACVMEIYSRACEQRPFNGVRRSRWAIIRANYPELINTTLRTWVEWIPETICPINRQPPMRGVTWQKLGDGTILNMEVIFLALDDESTISKLKSFELTGGWINEAAEVPKAILDNLRARVDRYPGKRMGGTTWAGVIMDTNPPDDDHWWYQLAEVEKPENYEFWKQPPAVIMIPPKDKRSPPTYVANQGQVPGIHRAENAENHNKGYDYWMDLVPGSDPEWIKVYLQGDYGTVIAGKPVMSEYNDSLHCATEPLKPYRGLPLILSLDFGLTPAAAFCQVSPRGQFRCIDELVCEDGGIRSFARDVILPHIARNYHGIPLVSVGDPAGNQRAQTDETTCIQELTRLGIPCEPAATNNFIARREALAGFMTKIVDGEPGFLLCPEKCQMIRKGLMGRYRYKKVRTSTGDRYTDKPDKNEYSHPCEALQYGAVFAQGPIHQSGDVVGVGAARSQRRKVTVKSSTGWT